MFTSIVIVAEDSDAARDSGPAGVPDSIPEPDDTADDVPDDTADDTALSLASGRDA